MVLNIFSCCFGCCSSAQTLWRSGHDPLKQGANMLESDIVESRHNQEREQRAYELIAEGISYLKQAEAKNVDGYDANFKEGAPKLIASFCASSLCSKQLENYLINRRVFVNEGEFKSYVRLWERKKFNWGLANTCMSKADRDKYSKDWALWNTDKQKRAAQQSRDELQRKEEESKKAEEQREKQKKDALERRREIARYDEQKQLEASRKQKELEDYEQAHPEARYQREAAQTAREQAELLREQNELLKEKNRLEARRSEQANEQTRLLEQLKDNTSFARRVERKNIGY